MIRAPAPRRALWLTQTKATKTWDTTAGGTQPGGKSRVAGPSRLSQDDEREE